MTEAEWNIAYGGLINGYLRDLVYQREVTNSPLAKPTPLGAKYADMANAILTMLYPLASAPEDTP
jgi:hypothetical protein